MNQYSRQDQFQTIGTLLALVISSLALFVSIYEANILKSQQESMVWPYLTVSKNYSSDGFSFVVNNNGTGPAIVKSMEVRYKGQPVQDFDALLDRIKPDRKIGYDRLRMSGLNNDVVKVGERRIIFNMPWDKETRKMSESMIYVQVVVQYCSVLGDCWVYDFENDEHRKGKFRAEVEFDQ